MRRYGAGGDPAPSSAACPGQPLLPVWLKPENLQIAGSFKVRGAANKVLSLSQSQLQSGLVAASAGNHAQGLARAARLAGAKATVVMPETTPKTKVDATRRLGAEIVFWGRSYDEAEDHAHQLERQRGLTYVHASDDPKVVAGQGTVGLEILEELPDAAQIIVPAGGGGLISGIAVIVKAINPRIRIVGVQ